MNRALAGAIVLPLLSASAAAQEAGTRTSVRFLDAPPAWVVALVVVPLIALLTAAVYRRESAGASRRVRAACGALRSLAFLLVFLFLFRPVRETQQVEYEKSVVPVLLDASSSMTRADAYADSDVKNRLAERAGLAGDIASTPRTELVKAILANPATDPSRILAERNTVKYFAFGEEVQSLESPADLDDEAAYTRIGNAIKETINEFAGRGERVTDMLLITDGRNNSGLDPREAAAQAALDGIRIHTIGVGDPNEPKNVEVKSVRAPDVALVNDDVAFEVVITSKGYEGRLTSLTLRSQGSDQVLASEEVTLGGRGREQTEIFYWRPEREGEYVLEIRVEKLPGEQFEEDNMVVHHLRVDPEEIRVLYVEGYPRWEYRFLKNVLLRAKNMQAQCLLLDADKDFIQESSEGLPALTAFPPTRQALFEYDVVIFGDVDPYALADTPQQAEELLANVKELVELGGGFVMIAGVLDAPRSYAGTPIEDILPVVLGDAEEERRANADVGDAPFRPQLENPLQPHEVVRLETDLAKNRKLWEDAEVGLPPQEWYWPVRKAKGGAEVLLRHPEASNQFGPHVLMATTYYPTGRTVFLGFDSTWLWRRFYGDRYTERFWRATIRYAALNKLRRTDKRFDLLTDKSLYDVNEPIQISARVYDADFRPLISDSHEVQLLDPDGRQTTITLANIDPDEGRFGGTIRVGKHGIYQAWLEDSAGHEAGRLSPKSFRVEIPRHEWENPVLARDTLEAVSAATNGRYYGLDRVDEALAAIGGEVIERERGDPTREELWSSWWSLLLFVALLSGEWILRKKHNLL